MFYLWVETDCPTTVFRFIDLSKNAGAGKPIFNLVERVFNNVSS